MPGCSKILNDGKPCGLTVHTNGLCQFHAIAKHGMHNHDNKILLSYIKNTNRDPIDLRDIRFNNYIFDKEFSDALKERAVNFGISKFFKCKFKCNFKKRVYFNSCRFDDSYFIDSSFSDSVSFNIAYFVGKEPHFNSTYFNCDVVSFSDSYFGAENTPFFCCSIKAKQVQFNNTQIDSNFFSLFIHPIAIQLLDRKLVIAADEIFLDELKVSGHFEYSQKLDLINNYSPIVRFVKINFSTMKSATFVNANLKQARFTYSVLDSVKFVKPLWAKESDRFRIYDDIVRVYKTGDQEIAETYTQLKKNYDSNCNYAESGQWFFREMECRRKMIATDSISGWRWIRQNIISWNALYRWSSQYGESWGRPLLLLFFVLLLGTGVHLLIGEQDFNNNICGDLCDSFARSFWSMIFQFRNVYENYSKTTYLIVVLQQLFVIILLPLFILALRRRFKR